MRLTVGILFLFLISACATEEASVQEVRVTEVVQKEQVMPTATSAPEPVSTLVPIALTESTSVNDPFASLPCATRCNLTPTPAPSQVKELQEKEEKLKEYLLDKPMFIEFFSSTCLSCILSMPVINALKEDFGEKADFVLIDILDYESKDFVIKHNVMQVPTFVILDRNGEEFFRGLGLAQDQVFRPKLEQVLRQRSR